MDWLGKMIGLPSDFLHSNKQTMGGGVIQVRTVDTSTLLYLREHYCLKWSMLLIMYITYIYQYQHLITCNTWLHGQCLYNLHCSVCRQQRVTVRLWRYWRPDLTLYAVTMSTTMILTMPRLTLVSWLTVQIRWAL